MKKLSLVLFQIVLVDALLNWAAGDSIVYEPPEVITTALVADAFVYKAPLKLKVERNFHRNDQPPWYLIITGETNTFATVSITVCPGGILLTSDMRREMTDLAVLNQQSELEIIRIVEGTWGSKAYLIQIAGQGGSAWRFVTSTSDEMIDVEITMFMGHQKVINSDATHEYYMRLQHPMDLLEIAGMKIAATIIKDTETQHMPPVDAR